MTRAILLLLTALAVLGLPGARATPLMIVGLDEKPTFDDHG